MNRNSYELNKSDMIDRTKQNQYIFKLWGVKLFTDSTRNTCTFNCTEKDLERFKELAKQHKYNPYALMTW